MLNRLLIGLWVIGTATVLGVCLALALTGGVDGCTTDCNATVCSTDQDCYAKTGVYYGGE